MTAGRASGERTELPPTAGDGLPVLTLAHSEPAEPAKARRARKPRATRNATRPAAHWPPSHEAEAVLRRVLGALADAREAAGWPRGWKATSQLRRDAHGGLALRLAQLLEDGEDAEALLTATMQAKVHEQARRRGDGQQDAAARAGQYATALSICRDAWWSSNLAAGRAWLAGSGARAPRGTGGVVGSSFRRASE